MERSPMPPRREPMRRTPRPRTASDEFGPKVPSPRRPRDVGPVWSSESRARRIVRERAEGRCELGCGMPGHDWSHRRARVHGGLWYPTNGALACRRCHAACEAFPVLADIGGWRIVHRDPDPGTAPIYLQALGDRPTGWYFLTDTTAVESAPWAPAPLWLPWMPRPR
jgi:hypothetical protein